MKKDTITLNVGRQQTMRIDAYLTDDPVGLAIHRAVTWVPAKNEHKFISKWTLTHIETGLTLLKPSDYLPTMKACISLAKELNWIDWRTGEMNELIPFRKDVSDAISRVKHGETFDMGDTESSPRYVIRRARGAGYEVVDTMTDTSIETFSHRGLASLAAKEKNAQESL